jgi:hypothetical protein
VPILHRLGGFVQRLVQALAARFCQKNSAFVAATSGSQEMGLALFLFLSEESP